MKTLTEFITEHINIFEGGNAISNATPIPADIAPLVYKEVEEKVKAIFKGEIAPIGSLGKKMDDDFNGDIDIVIDIPTKDELGAVLDKVFSDYEINKKTGPSIISVGYPFNINGKSGVAQIDFMIVKNMNWAKFRYSSPDFKKGESKYKAAVKNMFLSIVVSEIPVKDAENEYFDSGEVQRKWKYTFNTEGVFKQLLDYTGKNGKPLKNPKKLKEFETLITNDPLNCAKFIFGDKADLKDFTSVETLWKAVHTKFSFGYDIVKKIEDRFFDEVGKEYDLDKTYFYNL